ncbi:MAG: hypothetical protein AAFQ43_07485, partial [Bacteroidota bacterium]
MPTLPLRLACLTLFVTAVGAHAQPATDLWRVDLNGAEPQPVPLTDRDGYDNQPHVTPDGSAVLYTSARDGQTDIYRLDLATGASTQVTDTPESEYSPTMMPGGERFSVIRVESDGTQRLWSAAMDGTDWRLVLEEIAPVGYHAWAGPDRVALFVLGEPPTLQLASTASGDADTLAGNIGRSLLPIPARNSISFVQKAEDGPWSVRALDLTDGTITDLGRTLPNREDLAWLLNGRMLMAD